MLTLLITQFIIFWTVVGRIRATSVSTRLKSRVGASKGFKGNR